MARHTPGYNTLNIKAEDVVSDDLAPHYRKMKIEPIVFIQENELPWTEGEIIKYISRWRHKGGVSDLRKAVDLINRLIAKEKVVIKVEYPPEKINVSPVGWTDKWPDQQGKPYER